MKRGVIWGFFVLLLVSPFAHGQGFIRGDVNADAFIRGYARGDDYSCKER